MTDEEPRRAFGDPATDVDSVAPAAAGRWRGDAERRVDHRARVLLAGRVIVGDCLTSIDCVIRNLSVSGAQVRIPSYQQLPPDIRLLLISEGLLFDATIVWRVGDKIGVFFRDHRDLRTDCDPSHSAVRALWMDLAPQ